jgi:O-antigen ligase/polysaccharide polymerase Wzy-like membrane protein/tetratricopeptide repeat protein
VSRSDPLGSARPAVRQWAATVPAPAVALPALLVFVVITTVSAAGGGYFPTEWGWSAIGLLLVAAAAIAVRKTIALGRLEWTMLGGFTAFTAWVALSTAWSTSAAQPVLETERDVVYVAALAALLLIASRASVSWLAGGVLAATYSVAIYPLATRLVPDHVGSHRVSSTYQLAEPFGYWNTLGLFVAMGLLIGLGFVAHGQSGWLRACAAAALVPLACTLYFTFSRGAWLALLAGALLVFALDPARLRVGVVLLVLAPAPALGVLVASRSDALTSQGANAAAAARDGHRVAGLLVLLSALQALAAIALHGPARRFAADRRVGLAAAGAAAVLVGSGAGLALVRVGGPTHLVGNAYDAFVSPERPSATDLNRRLVNLSGSGRSDYWRVAWHDYLDHPLLGSGAGSYERFWVRDRPNAFYARDAHNLYLETLAELGPIGLALLLVALATPLLAAVRLRRRPLVAALAGAYGAFVLHAGLDWDWEVTGLTVTALVCGAALVLESRPSISGRTLSPAVRAASLAFLASLVAFVFVLHVGNTTVAAGGRALERGDLAAAESHAHRAASWLPWSFQPWDVLAGAQLARGDLAAARASLRTAIEKDPQNWNLWFELAQASRGAARTSALERAHRLAPHSREIEELRRASHS